MAKITREEIRYIAITAAISAAASAVATSAITYLIDRLVTERDESPKYIVINGGVPIAPQMYEENGYPSQLAGLGYMGVNNVLVRPRVQRCNIF